MARMKARSTVNKAELYRKEARKQLEKLARIGTRQRGYFPERWGPTGDRSNNPDMQGLVPGQYNVRYGIMPTDADVERFIAQTGGNPYLKTPYEAMLLGQRMRDPRLPVPPAMPPGPPGPRGPAGRQAATMAAGAQDPMGQLFADLQSKIDEANAANIARYDEGKGELTDLRDRNQGRIDSWGVGQQMRNKEAFDEFLSNQRAQDAMIGMANSNKEMALGQRQLRDMQMLDAEITGQRDARGLAADTADTGKLTEWIYNRNDNAPDPAMLIDLAKSSAQAKVAQQYADAETKALLAEAKERIRASRRGGVGGGGGGYFGGPRYSGGGAGPIFMNGTPLDMAQRAFAGLGMAAMGGAVAQRPPRERGLTRQQQYNRSGKIIQTPNGPVQLRPGPSGIERLGKRKTMKKGSVLAASDDMFNGPVGGRSRLPVPAAGTRKPQPAKRRKLPPRNANPNLAAVRRQGLGPAAALGGRVLPGGGFGYGALLDPSQEIFYGR